MGKVSKTTEVNDIHAPKFAALIERHLENLGWNNVVFSQKTAAISNVLISPAQLSRWAKGHRSVSRAMAIRAAVTLALEYENQRAKGGKFDPSDGLDNLDAMIQVFLNEAGYPGNLKISQPLNVVWNKIQETKRIVVGYAPCPPWAREGREVPVGIAIEVARRVIILLGLEVRWEQLTWDEMPDAVRERRVDLIAPILMDAPSRLYDFRLSKPLLRSKYGLGFLAPKAIVQGKEKSFEGIKGRYVLGYVTGEIGEIAKSLLPAAYAFQEHKDLDSAVSWLTEPGQSVPRIFASEHNTCAQKASEDELKDWIISLPPPLEWKDVKFGVCFGAHPDERQLIHAVDHCLSLIDAIITKEFGEDLEPNPAKKTKA